MGNTIYKSPRNEYNIVGNHIECLTDKPYKISGTMLAAVLGVHPYKSQFEVGVELFGLADADLTDNKSVNAGHVCEVPIVKYANEVFWKEGQFIPAEKIFPARTGEHGDWEPDFLHPVFTGHIDGIVIEPNGEQYLLEVKTTKDAKGWDVPEIDFNGCVKVDAEGNVIYRHGGIPDQYYWQVALYNEFFPDMQKDYVYVLRGDMTDKDLENPEAWVPDAFGKPEEGIEPNLRMVKVPIDHDEVKAGIAEAMEWYSKYTLKGITPDYNPDYNKDYALWNHLQTVISPEGKIQSQIDRYEMLNNHLKLVKREVDQLKENIEEWMTLNKRDELNSEYGLVATRKINTRSTFDRERFEKETGLDYDDFKSVKTYQSVEISNPSAPKKRSKPNAKKSE